MHFKVGLIVFCAWMEYTSALPALLNKNSLCAHVRVYICVCACVYVCACMHVCMCVCMCSSMRACMRACMQDIASPRLQCI